MLIICHAFPPGVLLCAWAKLLKTNHSLSFRKEATHETEDEGVGGCVGRTSHEEPVVQASGLHSKVLHETRDWLAS